MADSFLPLHCRQPAAHAARGSFLLQELQSRASMPGCSRPQPAAISAQEGDQGAERCSDEHILGVMERGWQADSDGLHLPNRIASLCR